MPGAHRVKRGSPLTARFTITPDGCWLWQGARKSNGYGNVRWQGKVVPAHRAVWEVLVGPCPLDKQFHHVCGNRPCVNPAHGQWVPVAAHNNFGRWRY